MFVIKRNFFGWAFAVAHFWCTHFELYAVFPLDSFDIHVQVKFTHTADQNFIGFFIGEDSEGWVFLSETL